jgi:hypothetical protein
MGTQVNTSPITKTEAQRIKATLKDANLKTPQSAKVELKKIVVGVFKGLSKKKPVEAKEGS